MSYQVLARKLRPMHFSGLVGQEHVVRALSHALDAGRLHHAYLFTGTRGVGKTTIARILAKCLNCESGVSSTPCGTCSICLEVQENRFIDLIEVDAASRTRVDDTRELLDNAQYLPSRGRYKVYLIDEVHMLSASSFNALLKTLEEPPEHVKFLLATTDPKKVPVTVLSRCLQFQLKNISRDKIVEYLAEAMVDEAIEFEQAALEIIAKSARGSMRDALSVCDQAISYGRGRLTRQDVADMLGSVGPDEVKAIVDALHSGRLQNVLAVSNELAEKSADFEATLGDLIEELHRIAVDQALGSYRGPFTAEAIQLYYQIALMGYRDLSVGPDPKTGFEMTLLRMMSFAPDAGSAGNVPPLEVAEADEVAEAEPEQVHNDDASTESARASTKSARPQHRAQPDSVAADLLMRWYDLVENIQLDGVARMILEHSVMVDEGEAEMTLRLDPNHDTLLNNGHVAAIERALQSQMHRDVKVLIEVAESASETPAARNVRIQTERLAVAQQHLETDETVRALIDEFGGKLVQVKALNADQQEGQSGGGS